MPQLTPYTNSTTTLSLPLSALPTAHVAFAAGAARTTRQISLALPRGRCVVDITGAPATAAADSFRVTVDEENGGAGRVQVVRVEADLVPWGVSEERGDEGVSGEQGAEAGGAGVGQQDHQQHQGYEKQGEAQDSRQLAYRVRIALLLPHQPTPDETHHGDTDSERTVVATTAEDGEMESAEMSGAPLPSLSLSLSLSYSIPSTPNEQRPQCQQEDQNQGEEKTHTQRQRRRLFPLLPLPLGLGLSHSHDDKTKDKDKHHSNSNNSSTSPSPLTSPITSPTTSGSKSKSKAMGKSKHLFGLGLGASQRSVEDAEREIHALFGLDAGYGSQSHPPTHPHAGHGQSPRRSVEHSQRTIETLLGLGTQM